VNCLNSKIDLVTFRLFVFWYTVGIFLLTFDLVPPPLEWANAVFLILCGILGGFYFIRTYGLFIGGVTVVVIMVFSITAEVFGVSTGLLFGDYDYNPDFGLVFFNVPFTIGTAWLMVIATTHALVSPWFSHVKSSVVKGFGYVLTASLFAVAIDLVIDPVAFEVKTYWEWGGTDGFYYGIPFSNFVGWFIVAFVLHSFIYVFFHLARVWDKQVHAYWWPRTVALFYMIVFMFTFLCAVNGLWLAAISGVVTMVVARLITNRFNRSHL